MEKQVNRLFLFFVVLFLALIGQLTYVQVYAAPSLRVHQANTRAIEAEMRIHRGRVVSADGVVLADVHEEGVYYMRDYADPALVAPWIGYVDLRYGKAAVERVYDPQLSGDTGLLTLRSLVDRITGEPRRGADLHSTVDTRVQAAAAEALGDRVGAVVALDPRTGGVLALVSSPRYDPDRVGEDWEALNENEARPLLNRATQGLYPPGSTFKVVTASAGIQEGVVARDTTFTDEGSWAAGGFRVNNYGGAEYGEHSFAIALAKSINTTFAKVGVDLGAETLAGYAEDFGFNHELPWALGGAVSVFPDPATMDTAHVAQAAYGQGEVLATPMEMALVAAGIAQGGEIMGPTLVAEWRDAEGDVIERSRPELWLRPVSAQTAATVRDLMVLAVEQGTGTRAAITGVSVAGKTGTAEVAEGEPHAWFIGFAPATAPTVAVAVLVEHGGAGGVTAAPIARAVMQAALRR